MLSASEAAAELGISVVTVRKLCQTGKLRATKWGAMWVISRTDLADFPKRADRRRGWLTKSRGLTSASATV